MENFNELIKSEIPVVVDFYADWCVPCKKQGPILHEVETLRGGSVKVLKVNVDDNSDISNEYKIKSIPTIMIFKNGELRYRSSGLMTKDNIISELDKIK